MTPAENLFPNKGTCTGSREWTDSLGEGGTDQRVSVCCVLPQLFLDCPSSPGHCLSDWLASFLSHLWAPFPSTFLTLKMSPDNISTKQFKDHFFQDQDCSSSISFSLAPGGPRRAVTILPPARASTGSPSLPLEGLPDLTCGLEPLRVHILPCFLGGGLPLPAAWEQHLLAHVGQPGVCTLGTDLNGLCSTTHSLPDHSECLAGLAPRTSRLWAEGDAAWAGGGGLQVGRAWCPPPTLLWGRGNGRE